MYPVANCSAPIDVLIAEDDCDVRMAVRHLLEGKGYTCAEAGDGRAAVALARQSLPRLVLMDLMMPEMDGFTAAQQLRADPQTCDVHIHCLTALTFPAARRAAHQAGCDGYLTKPFNPDELLEVVDAAIRSGGSNEGLLAQFSEQLLQTVKAPAPGREHDWITQVRAALTGLEGTLRKHAEQMESAKGLLAAVELTRPTVVRQVDELRRQHAGLREQAGTLLKQVDNAARAFQTPAESAGRMDALPPLRASGPVVNFSTLRQAAVELVSALNRHLEGERDLLFESMNTEIGVGD